MEKKLFRHIPETTLLSLEDSHQPLQLVGLKSWIILSVFVGVFFAIVGWLFFGSLSITATGKGSLAGPTKFYAYVPIAKGGDRVQPQMQARISFTVVEKEKWGSLLGKVISTKVVINDDGPVVLVEIQPKEDPQTISGFNWTIRSGPPFAIPLSSVGSVSISLEKERPIFFLIPKKRKIK